MLFDRHPIQAGAGCSQKNLGWYVTFEFSVGDVAECCDSHWCALDSWVICKLRLPQSGRLKHLSSVRQLLLFRAKQGEIRLRKPKNNFSPRCKTCRAMGLRCHNSGDVLRFAQADVGKGCGVHPSPSPTLLANPRGKEAQAL